MPASTRSPFLSSFQAFRLPSCASPPLEAHAKHDRGAGTPTEIKVLQTMQTKAAVVVGGNGEIRKPLQESNAGVTPENLPSATRSGRIRRKVAASSNCEMNLSGRRRKVEEDDVSTHIGIVSGKMAFAGRHEELQEGGLVTPKALSRGLGKISSPEIDLGFSNSSKKSNNGSDGGDASHPSDPKRQAGNATEISELQQFSLPVSAGNELFRFGTSSSNNSTPEQSYSPAEDDANSSLMPENEEEATSPSPEKSGNWRLNAVLESFGYLSPTREGRVKTLVRAFESLLSVTERKGEQQARKTRGHSLKFSYLHGNENGQGDSQKDDFGDGAGGESEQEEAPPGGESFCHWQTNLSERYVEDEELGDHCQMPLSVPVYTQSVSAEDEEKDEQRAESRKEAVGGGEGRDGEGKLLQTTLGTQEFGDDQNCRVHKRRQRHENGLHCAKAAQQCVMDTEGGGTDIQSQFPDGNKENHPDEHQPPEEEQQPPHIMSAHTSGPEGDADHSLQELEVGNVPAFSMEATAERHLPNKKIRTNLQQGSSQKSILGRISSASGRKKQSCNKRETVRGSSCSLSSKRPPLQQQKSQVQPLLEKPRVSKLRPFNLLTEARGHAKEEEFLMRLRKIVEEEERLRVPLAQGLPWTTDEPEILQKPPVKVSTKPLDIQLYSDLRAMERAEFDRFIAEKLLYIEERRLEEESRHRAAEEEKIKKMRQEMVPKAQLMPYFDRPFRPRRSSKRPTIPKEPQFRHNKQQFKRQKCVASLT